jgi:hypothetical protein
LFKNLKIVSIKGGLEQAGKASSARTLLAACEPIMFNEE